MAHKTVVRNQAYKRDGVGIRERHNERKNECYSNADIQLERSPMNVYYKQCEGTYLQEFDKLVEDKVISLRGLRENPKIIDEMIFDVNTSYFEQNGGYEFAKEFYAEAYNLAVKEVGSEQYILSAVMHADEVNVGVSAELGKDVYHYHLHVVYIPMVEKEILYSKRCRDKALVGTVKDVVQQVSHSKKWWKRKNENGEWINSYSILQDRFYEHMKSAGFKDFERGEPGSTAKHLTDTEYKVQQEQKRLDSLEQTTSVKSQQTVTFSEIDAMAKPTLLGKKVEVSAENWEKVSNWAKEGIVAKPTIDDLSHKLEQAREFIADLQYRFGELYEKTKWFLKALERFPQRVSQFIRGIINEPMQGQKQKNIDERSGDNARE